MSQPPLARLLELQRLLTQFRNIQRVVHYTPDDRENDTEHSYTLAITGWFIAQYFPELDCDKVILYSLVHDLVEIHAGDTFLYADEALLASKASREAAAFEQLRSDWPDFPELITAIEVYNRHDTPESAFVYALDKIMPIMLLYISGGHTWKKENITLEKLHAKKIKIATTPVIGQYYEKLYELLKRSPELISPR